ncbi:MAG TPA: hypothetical protein VLM79_05645 [Kofleriaceae bacterium]|nr:hypothetical protein [Kofleriaceae bacterium]
MQRLWLSAALAAAPLGCTSDPPPECIDVSTSCAPFYQPTFDNLYTMTLKATCGSADAACHSAVGRSGGMSFADEASAYAALTAGRVKPGDPSCSKVVVRTSSLGASYQMPPGDPLREGERCALIQWVQAGAPAPSGAAGGSP